MATKVVQVYTPSLNLSVTTNEKGTVTKVTHWVTGVPNSTERILDSPDFK